MKRILSLLAALYLLLCVAVTAAYHAFPEKAWAIATHRGPAAIVTVDASGAWFLPPFDPYGDSWECLFRF